VINNEKRLPNMILTLTGASSASAQQEMKTHILF